MAIVTTKPKHPAETDFLEFVSLIRRAFQAAGIEDPKDVAEVLRGVCDGDRTR